jgi:hypothetical protein
MIASVSVDDKPLKLNPFMSNLTANIILSLSKSLKAPEGKRIEFFLEKEDLHLLVDAQDVPLDLGHAKHIIGNILNGLIKSLHGAASGRKFRFVCEQE